MYIPLIVNMTTPVFYYASNSSSSFLQTKLPVHTEINHSDISGGTICVSFGNPFPGLWYYNYYYWSSSQQNYDVDLYNNVQVNSNDYMKWIFFSFKILLSVEAVSINISCEAHAYKYNYATNIYEYAYTTPTALQTVIVIGKSLVI